MVLFLRNAKNETIVDTEFYRSDDHLELHSSVIIDTYSDILLENLHREKEIISDFNFLSGLRGWLWECYFAGRRNTSDEYEIVLENLRNTFRGISKKYDLMYVED